MNNNNNNNNNKMEKDDLDYLLPSNGPNPYYDTWDRHNSIAFSTATKGLHNAPGENNCFVNSAVQVFWHLDVFRRSYRRLSGHTCMGNSCIFCALKVIFTQFQFSDQSSLHPDALRKALADTFANQQRFQLGHMDDAAECFENILKRIHFHIAHNHPEDTCTAPHCLPHQKFSLGIVEKVVCPCGASSKPLQYREMVHYISVSALVSQAQLMQDSGDVLHPDRFGLLLRSANALGDIRQCPGSCGKTVQIRRTLLNIPDVVSIGLGWDSDHPTMEMTTKVARSIGTAILLQDVFHSVMQDQPLPKLQLVGLVCYYCKHYSTFVFHSKLGVWIYFDDTTVKEIGPSFDHVVEKCSRGRYQPLLLLYANPNSTPVPTDSAPKKRVMAPGYHLPGSEEENTLDRTHESISSQNSVQRAMTPNPEPSSQMADTAPYTRARSVTPSSHDAAIRKEAPSPSLGSDHSRQQSFMMAMSKTDPKIRHPLRMGGQSGMAGMPGPMTPVQEQEVLKKAGGSGPHPHHHPHHHQPHHHPSSQQSSAFHRPDIPQDPHNTSYADYTLSNNNQYKRPTLTGFTPDDLPLTPNQKSGDSPRKDSFKRNKEPIRADIIRHPSDSSGKMSTTGYSSNSSNSNYQDFNVSQQQARTNMRSSAMFYQGPGSSNPHFRQRSLSQGGDEAYASDSSEYSRPVTDHVVVKPMAGGHSPDNDDKHNSYAHTHTAVQSGLATLPRKKKNQTAEEIKNPQNSGGSGSGHNFRPVSNPQYDMSRHTPVMDSSGLPPMALGRVTSPIMDQIDSAGVKKSTGKDESEKEKKILKKAKKELKKSEKKKMRSNPNASAVETALMTRSASADEEILSKTLADTDISDEQQRYINRKMVASVLKHQGLQRQPSTHSTNSQTSNSSLESEGIMGKLLAAKAHGDASFDNVSLGSHKDSGYGSSDRNSSSSTGSGTIDPSVQYFLSKSMVIPRNFNSQMFEKHSQFVTDFTAPNPHVYASQYGGQGEGHDTDTMHAEDKNRIGYQPIGQRKVMHPIKESSQEDMLKIMPKEVFEAGGKKSARSSPIPDSLQSKEGRPPPIPPKNFAAFIVSKSAHQREPSIDSLDKDEVTNDYFVSMCEKADDLMDRCILAETQENLPDALRYCDSALGCLKEAMNQMDIEKNAAIYAQKKHKSCLLKSRSLFKRVSSQTAVDGRPGKRSSITSTDSDNSEKLVRRAPSKERLMAGRTSANGHHHQKDVCNSSLDSTGSARQSPMPGSQVPEGMHIKMDPTSYHGLRYDTVPAPQPPSSHIPKDNGEKLLKSHVSRTQMVDRSDSGSNHSRSGSNSSVRSSVSVPCSLSSQQQPPAPMLPKSQSSIAPMSSSCSSSGNSGPVPLDPYGTLSRTRKPRRTSDPTGNTGDSYQMFANKQTQLHHQGNNGSDRCSTDSRDSDSSSNDGNPQRKTSKAEIRELLENNFVQQQKHQLMSGPGPVVAADQGNGQVTRTRHSYEGSTSSSLTTRQQPLPPPPSSLSSAIHQNKGQSAAAAAVQYQQSSTGRPAAVRHSMGGQGQTRSSPVPMSHDQGMMIRPAVSTSNPSMPRLQTTSPAPHHPYPQQGPIPIKQNENNNHPHYHHDRSPTQHHYIDNTNNSQRPLSSVSSPTSSTSSSSSSPQRPQPQAHPVPSSHHHYQQQQHHQHQQYPPPPPSSSSSSSHPPHTVSGYSQPLPGHRIPPYSNVNTRPTTTTPTPSSSAYPHHLSSPTPSPVQFTQRDPSYPPPSQSNNFPHPHPSSQSNYIPTPSSLQSTMPPPPPPGHNINHSASVQWGSNPPPPAPLHHQNLSSPPSRSQPTPQDPRRPIGGAPPPPPPARTTSNPDFRIQLIQQPSTATHNTQPHPNIHHHQQQQQLMQQQQQQLMQQQQQQNVARVQPNSHLLSRSQTPTSSSSGPQQEPLYHPNNQHYHRQGPPPPPHTSTASSISSSNPNRYSFTSASLSQSANIPTSSVSQLKHAYSSTGLNNIAASMAPRPLERCTSQPDCQNLPEVDPYSSDRDGSSFPPPPLRHPASHHPANTNTAAVHMESGPSMRLGGRSSDSPDTTGMERQKSVKDLLSRFDQPSSNSIKPAVKPKPSSTRNRSKSESGSKKPKSVLKNKKAKSGSGKNRKSVTFAQDFSEKASGYESAAELTSFSSSAPINDRAYFSDDEEHSSSYYNDDMEVESSNSDEAPPPEELACQLCHKREIETGRAYCSKCYFYMSRLTS